jgi:hypothetical protein
VQKQNKTTFVKIKNKNKNNLYQNDVKQQYSVTSPASTLNSARTHAKSAAATGCGVCNTSLNATFVVDFKCNSIFLCAFFSTKVK